MLTVVRDLPTVAVSMSQSERQLRRLIFQILLQPKEYVVKNKCMARRKPYNVSNYSLCTTLHPNCLGVGTTADSSQEHHKENVWLNLPWPKSKHLWRVTLMIKPSLINLINFYVRLDFYLYHPTLNLHPGRFASADLKKTPNRALIDA